MGEQTGKVDGSFKLNRAMISVFSYTMDKDFLQKMISQINSLAISMYHASRPSRAILIRTRSPLQLRAVSYWPKAEVKALHAIHEGLVEGRWLAIPWTYTPRPTVRNPNPRTYTSNYTPVLNLGGRIPVTHDGTYVLLSKRQKNFPYHSTVRFHRQLALDLRCHFHTPMPAPSRRIHVHHLDGNPANNHTSNLQVLTAPQHMRLHAPPPPPRRGAHPPQPRPPRRVRR